MSSRKYDGYSVVNVKCVGCGKATTSGIDGTNLELCRPCFEEAGWENAHLDGHPYENEDGSPVDECPYCQKGLAVGESS